MKTRFDLLLVILGIAVTLYVAARIPDEVFFSGDGGLKTLHAKQHLREGFSVTLNLEAEPWIRGLWSDGLYPFKPPFVYEEDGEYIVGFPFLFPLVTAPLYKLAGFRGLYVLPLACLWLLWLRFHLHCRKIDLEWPYALVGMALLIFASPLTMYGAIFWEHVPAAFLAFFGLDFIAGLHGGRRGKLHPVFYGLLAGLAVWFRAEYLCLVALFVLLALLAERSRRIWWFAGGAALSMAAFFIANVALYRHPLGAHSRQVLAAIPPAERLSMAPTFFADMARELVVDYPASLIALAAIPFLFTRGKTDFLSRYARALAAAGIAFLVLVPLIVPNAGGKQLGPRYILFLAPVVALLVPIAMRRLSESGRGGLRIVAYIAIGVALLAGCYRSIYFRGAQLIRDYEGRVVPALEAVLDHPSKYVLVSRQWTAQELEITFDRKTFFHAPDAEDSVKLAEALAEHGVLHFLLVLDYQDSAPAWLSVAPPSPVQRIEFSSMGLYGAYYVFEATIVPRLQGGSAIM
jgi:hypothetical protein